MIDKKSIILFLFSRINIFFTSFSFSILFCLISSTYFCFFLFLLHLDIKYDKKVYEKKRLIKYIEIPIVSFANYSYMFHVFLLILLSYFLNLMIQSIRFHATPIWLFSLNSYPLRVKILSIVWILNSSPGNMWYSDRAIICFNADTNREPLT